MLYALVYLDYKDRTEAIEASNDKLSDTIAILQEYANNMATYQAEIEDMREAIGEILEEYPAGAREEDVIMMAVRTQEENQISYSSINMNDTETVYSIPANEVSLAAIEGMDTSLTFASKRATYSVTTTYDDLKSVVEQIFDNDNRIAINSIVLAKNDDEDDDATGTLDGSIDLNFYSAIGTGKVYQVPDISKYLAGTDNIFYSSGTSTSKGTGVSGNGKNTKK
jgi:Tfp pilus assembly protein PilO